MMNKLYTVLFLTCASLSGHAQKAWIDVTDAYMINPRFDNNDLVTGWEGTEYGAYNPAGNAEHYERIYDSYQTLSGLSPCNKLSGCCHPSQWQRYNKRQCRQP